MQIVYIIVINLMQDIGVHAGEGRKDAKSDVALFRAESD